MFRCRLELFEEAGEPAPSFLTLYANYDKQVN